MIAALTVWLAGVALGVLSSWLSVRDSIDPIRRSFTLIFGTLLSLFWPVVLVAWVVMGAWVVANFPEEIEL